MSNYCVSRLTIDGPPPVVERLDVASLVPVAFGDELGTYLSLPVAVPLPDELPSDEAGFCAWAQREWGCRDGPSVPAVVLERGPGHLVVEVTTRGGGIGLWARRVAALHDVAVEVLWNHESGAAGWITIAAGGDARSSSLRSDALHARGWDDAPWVYDAGPGATATADLLRETPPTDAAAVLRGAGTDDDVVTTAAVLTSFASSAPEAGDAVADAVAELDADFGRRARGLRLGGLDT